MQSTRELRLDGHYYGPRKHRTTYRGKPVHQEVPLTPERQALAEQWQYLPRYVVNRRYPNVNRDMQDELIGVASMALTEAAERFDFDRGIAFSTFATHWIRGRLCTARESDTRYVGGQFPTATLASGLVDDCESAVIDATAESSVFPDEPAAEITELRQKLDTLPERTRFILRHRYGLNGCEKMTLKELGLALGITRERVRQIENHALASLRWSICGGSK